MTHGSPTITGPIRFLPRAPLPALAVALVLVLPDCAPLQQAGVTERLRAEVKAAHKRAQGAEKAHIDALRRFYAHRHYQLAWFTDRRLNANAGALARALRVLPGDGVHEFEEDAVVLDSARRAAGHAWAVVPPSDSAVSVLEIRLTRAWLAASMRLRFGAIPDSALDRRWRRREAGTRSERRLAEALSNHAVAESLAASAPADSAYIALRAALAREVRTLQETHGLTPTGIVDGPTREVMDVAFAQRVRTVEANLERYRWLPQRPAGPHVEVNIADAMLEARSDSGQTLRMRVVVGDRNHPTPVFSTEIAWMDLNPTWTMTRRVVAEEVLPALRRDSTYLQKHQLQVLRPIDGVLTQVPVSAVNWDSVTSDTFRTFVRQGIGKQNPLGRIRFMCPNPFDVFLHDTNQRGLFRLADRAKSHGCVRLEHPLELAAWLLSLQVPTPVDSVQVALNDTTSRRWPLEPRVPLDVLYWTAWVDEQGVLQVCDDVYGLDARLMDAIEQGHPESFVLNPEPEWGIQREP